MRSVISPAGPATSSSMALVGRRLEPRVPLTQAAAPGRWENLTLLVGTQGPPLASPAPPSDP